MSIDTNIRCGHCKSVFVGTVKQAYRRRANPESTIYCSAACRFAGQSQKAKEQAIREGKKLRKGTMAGPCKTCGLMYESKSTDRQYCSIKCYGKSKELRDRMTQYWTISDSVKKKIAAGLQRGHDVACLECGNIFYQKPATKDRKAKKFCNKSCYRSYMAKRFDRWIANPGSMALPQAYDEFLDRDELECVVDGCGWKGVHLTTHMNQAHGIKAGDFKRATGFNLTTGVIGRGLAEVLRERSCVGVALDMSDEERREALIMSIEKQKANAKEGLIYKSLEGKEHYRKARLMIDRPGPIRTCLGCGTAFTQANYFGRTLYCSTSCRDRTYTRIRRATHRQSIES